MILFTKRFEEMLLALQRDMTEVQNDLSGFKQHVLTDLENMRGTVKDLILFVEESGEPDACRMTDAWKDSLSEEIRLLREQVALLSAAQRESEIVSKIPQSDENKDHIDAQTSFVQELKDFLAARLPDEPPSEYTKIEEMTRTFQEELKAFKKELEAGRQENAALLKRLEILDARYAAEGFPSSESFQHMMADLEKTKTEMTTAIRDELKEIQKALKEAKKDINARITYAVARLKT